MSATIGALLAEAAAALAAAGIEEPAREARLLLAHALGVSTATLLDRQRLAPASPYRSLVARRAAREPAALIIGSAGFWSLDLAVSTDTLIPRADSEAVVEAALAAFPDRAAPLNVLDLGTGTGALLLAVLAERPNSWGIGVDRSPAASRLAADNARRNGLECRSSFLAGDWVTAIDARFDLVLSNPPYICTAHMAALMPEVGRHEPALALDGGDDGLTAYRHLAGVIGRLLLPGGEAVIELGAGQDGPVAGLMRASGLVVAGLHTDLSGIVRVIRLRADAAGRR